MLLQLAIDGELLILEEREFRQFAVRLGGELAQPLSVVDLSSALGPDEEEWRLRHYEMIEYAGSKGWLRNNGSEVRLHVAPDQNAEWKPVLNDCAT
jgi:hypothetical protein